MEINMTKETLKVKKVICEKKEMISIQGDMIVPDSKPDILSTVNTSGTICIYKKEMMDGKIRIDGNVLTYIMYLADTSSREDMNDNIRGLNTGLDFSETISVPDLQEGMNADLIPTIKLIECKILNGRKIAIKASVEVSVKVYSKDPIDIITDMNDSNIQVLSKTMRVNSLLGDGMTKSSIKENISIPTTDNLAEILGEQVCMVDKDIKISYNKILAKSEVEVKLIYLTEDGRICTTRNRLPLVGFIDMPNIKEDNICVPSYLIKNIIIKPNSVEEHTVYIEMEVEISCIVYEEKEIKSIQDMYCPGEKMDFDQTMVNTISNKQCRKSTCSIREKVNVPELQNVEQSKIIDVEVNPTVEKQNKMNGKIKFEGEVELNFIFMEADTSTINSKKAVVPFEQTVDGIEGLDDCKVDTNIDIDSQSFENQAGTVSVNIDLSFEVSAYRNSTIPVISNISMEEDDDMEDYSVVIYVVKAGDTLWKIARRFGSTVDDIARVNGMENPNKLNAGEKIYIPKFVLKRAKEPIVLA